MKTSARPKPKNSIDELLGNHLDHYCVACGLVGKWKMGIWVSLFEVHERNTHWRVCSRDCYDILRDSRWLTDGYLKLNLFLKEEFE